MAGPEHHRGGVGAAVSDPARTARTAAAKAGGVLATTAPGVSTRTVRLSAAGLWTKASSLASSLRVAAAAPFAKVALVAVLAVIAAPPRGALAAPAQPTATTRELFAFASLAQAAYARSSPPNDAAGAFTLRTTSPTTQYYNFAEGTSNATDDSNGNATTLAGQLTEALGAAMPGWEALSATRKVLCAHTRPSVQHTHAHCCARADIAARAHGRCSAPTRSCTVSSSSPSTRMISRAAAT